MVGVHEVAAFVGGDVVHDFVRREDQAPGIAQAGVPPPARGRARAPARTGVHHRDLGRRLLQGGGVGGGPFGQDFQRLGLEHPEGGAAEGLALAPGPERQAVLFVEALAAGAEGDFHPAGAAKDLEQCARSQGLCGRQASDGFPDPGGALGGEGRGFLESAGRRGGGDDLAAGGVEPQADTPGAPVDLEPDGATSHLQHVAGGVARIWLAEIEAEASDHLQAAA